MGNLSDMQRADVVIIGAGFAGASTAFHLSRSFKGSILLIDMEPVPGAHASGRNASLILQSAEIPDIERATTVSRQFYASMRQELGFRQCGSLLLGQKTELEEARRRDPAISQFKDPAETVHAIPALEGHRFQSALWTPTDGVIDVSALLQFYLEQARDGGTELRLGCEVLEIAAKSPYELRTSAGDITASRIINAAGAWAPQVAAMAGAAQLPLTPFKRHLFTLGNVPAADRSQPFAWSLEHNFYFRPEGDGLLFSVCDEERCGSLEETVNPEISVVLAELIWRELPALQEAVQQGVWSCFRTKSRDGLFVIGWDPCADGFFWVAGLGGHGVGSSWAVGRIAAERFMDRTLAEPNPFNPARFGH